MLMVSPRNQARSAMPSESLTNPRRRLFQYDGSGVAREWLQCLEHSPRSRDPRSEKAKVRPHTDFPCIGWCKGHTRSSPSGDRRLCEKRSPQGAPLRLVPNPPTRFLVVQGASRILRTSCSRSRPRMLSTARASPHRMASRTNCSTSRRVSSGHLAMCWSSSRAMAVIASRYLPGLSRRKSQSFRPHWSLVAPLMENFS